MIIPTSKRAASRNIDQTIFVACFAASLIGLTRVETRAIWDRAVTSSGFPMDRNISEHAGRQHWRDFITRKDFNRIGSLDREFGNAKITISQLRL